MQQKTKYTISEASDLLGFSSRSTLNKKTKDGTLSCDKDSNGVKIIDASELARVFPDQYNKAMNNTGDIQYPHGKKIQDNTPPTTSESTMIINILSQQIERFSEDLKREREQNIDRENRFYSEKNELLGLVKNQNLMLTHQKESEPEKKKGIFELYKWPIMIAGGIAWLSLIAYLLSNFGK